jgi:copper chaperone CopZ
MILFMQLAYSQSSKIITTEIKTEIVCDHCLACESCDFNIFTNIKSNTKGVRKIKVNPSENSITVKYNSKKTTLEEIEKAILLSGFKANEHEPSNEAYNSLDGCCKKK